MASESAPAAKPAWQKPAVRSHRLPEPTLLLACSAARPVDCFPLDGVHTCVVTVCDCNNDPAGC